MLATKLDRLRCPQCSKTYKEVKLLNRHQREKHAQQKRWPCDYPGCTIDFQCLRFKTEHMKKQHADQIARSLSPEEQPGRGFREDMQGLIAPSPYESPYAEIAPQLPTTVALETPRLPFSPIVDEDLSTRTAASAYESSPRPYDSFDALASFQEQRGIGVNDHLRHPEHPRRLGADRTKPLSRPSVAPPREPQPSSALDLLDNTPEVPETFAESEPATEGLDDSEIEYTQAIITSIWDRDVDTLSKIFDGLDVDYELDIDFKFGETATDGSVERLLQDTTWSGSQRQKSHEALAGRRITDFTPMLRTLGPISLAIVIGFLDGVICIISRTGWSRQDLSHWLNCLMSGFVSIPQDDAITAFLSYNNRGTRLASSDSRESLSPGLLNSVNDELALCCPNPNNNMPGGMTWLEHAIRRGNWFGALVLLQRGADRNATLADGTPLVDFALEKDRDEMAVLLLRPALVVGREVVAQDYYRYKISRDTSSDGDGHESERALSILRRLKCAAESIEREVDGTWRRDLQVFIYGIRWGEARIRGGVPTKPYVMGCQLGFEILRYRI